MKLSTAVTVLTDSWVLTVMNGIAVRHPHVDMGTAVMRTSLLNARAMHLTQVFTAILQTHAPIVYVKTAVHASTCCKMLAIQMVTAVFQGTVSPVHVLLTSQEAFVKRR